MAIPEPVSHHDLADAIEAIVNAVTNTAEASGWDFIPDSPAVTDWSLNELPGEWGPYPLQDSYRTGLLLWWYQSDAALALVDAIRMDRPFAYVSLARALAEASARSWYLLELGIDATERIRRLMNDRLFAMYERHTMWHDEDFMAQLLERDAAIVDAIAQESQTRCLHYVAEKRGPRVYVPARIGEARPKSKYLISMAIKDDRAAAVFYRASSGLMHAALYSADGRLHFRPDGRMAVRGLDADRVVADITAAVVCMLVSVAATVSQTGWNGDRVQEAMDSAHEIWGRVE